MNWDGWGVYQRTNNDCGIGAIATLVGLSYERVEEAWRSVFYCAPKASSYKDLLLVLRELEIRSEKTARPAWGIRRARGEKYARHSHWIVTYSDGSLWCPTIGYVAQLADYGMPHLGHGIQIV